MSVLDMNQPYEVTNAMSESASDYFPSGTYEYIQNDTYFLRQEHVAASSLSVDHFSTACIDTKLDNIIPPDLYSEEDLKVATLGLPDVTRWCRIY